MPGVQEHTSELQSHDNLVCLEFRRVLLDRKSTRLNSSHTIISYAVFCLKKTDAGCAAEGCYCRDRRADDAGGSGTTNFALVSLSFFLKGREPPRFSHFPRPSALLC